MPAVKKAKATPQKSKFGLIINQTCKYSNVSVIPEYKFLDNRKFRFDYAIPELKIGIEYEGLQSSKSRHTTITGYTKDCEKYNLAVMNGWRVLRYTALNWGDVIDDLVEMISNNNYLTNK